MLINEECCSAVIHTRPGDTKSHAFGLTSVHNLECTSASGGVAGLMQDAGRKDCYLKTRDKETTFFFFFPKFTLLSVYLNKTTEMEPFGNNNGNLLPPSTMWFPSNYCHLLLVVPTSLSGFSSCQSQSRGCKDVLQPWAWGGQFIKPIYSI